MTGNHSQMNGSQRAADEETPLLRHAGKPSDGSRVLQRLRKHNKADVSKDWADCVLLFCYIITGLLDSSATFIWGSFVSMQTGNTVYLGLGLAAPKDGIRWIKAGTSLAAFFLGSFFFARFHRAFSPRRRWVLAASYFIQMLCIVAAALIVTYEDESASEGIRWTVIVPLAAVAFQSSGQAVTSRVLNYSGLTSVVLTSNYCDLFSDAKLFALKNVERNRRTAAPILLLIGAIVGGLWAHSSTGMRGALWTAVGLKAVTVIAWVVWKAEPEEED